jgi:hypothetical protein
MVAVVTELMVGGERSTQDDSIKGSARTLVSKLRLRALLQATARTHLSLTTSSPLLTNTFAQTCLSTKLPLAVPWRTIHFGYLSDLGECLGDHALTEIRRFQMADKPPSTDNSTPFTKLESSEARNSATVAISSD